jgi:CRP-like cAMP-binding protein
MLNEKVTKFSEDEQAKERWDNEGGRPLNVKIRKGQILMVKTAELKVSIANKLLALLPGKEYRRLLPVMEKVTLKYGENIYEPGDMIGNVYFPNRGIISLLASIESSASLEVGIVGREGVIGLAVFLGVKTSINRAIVQGKGSALKIKTADFIEVCNRGGALPKILRRFTHSLLSQISQSAVCFRFHPVEARLARWLLMTSDRMESNDFQITQDFLSNMLGVRREAVNKSAVILQNKEIIKYTRGKMRILDRPSLEKISCSCYSLIKAEELSYPLV